MLFRSGDRGPAFRLLPRRQRANPPFGGSTPSCRPLSYTRGMAIDTSREWWIGDGAEDIPASEQGDDFKRLPVFDRGESEPKV